MVLPWNMKGIAVKIWDKYHSCCIVNGKFHLVSHSESCPIANTTSMVRMYLSQISLLPMLILANIRLVWPITCTYLSAMHRKCIPAGVRNIICK